MKAIYLALITLAISTPSVFAKTLDTTFCGERYCAVDSVKKPVKLKETKLVNNKELFIVKPSALVVSHKTGATAHVAPIHQAKFQAYVNDLEDNGAIIKFMGGYRHERCSPPRHKHACGMALDVCQIARGVVRSECHLPSKASMIVIAARHGLTEGGQWCNQDRGHAEAGASVGPCNGRVAKRYQRIAKLH